MFLGHFVIALAAKKLRRSPSLLYVFLLICVAIVL